MQFNHCTALLCVHVHKIGRVGYIIPRVAFRMLKITAFILLVCSLQLSAKTSAQEPITVKAKGASLASVLKEVQRQTGYNFFLSEETIKNSKPIDIDVERATLKQVLDICFKNQPFTYSINENIITIIPKKKEKLNEEPTNSTLPPIDIEGRVVDKDGSALEGATIQVKGTNRSTVTNSKGEFFLKDINENAVLIITNIGYKTTTINLNGRTSVNIALLTQVATMDEIQVIGYGQTTKRFNTGNVSTIKAADIQKQPVNNPLLALEGRVPGMFITQATGQPGSAVTVQIRGQNSISNGNDPLYIIDGVPYTSQNFLPSLTTVLGSSNTTSGGQFTSGSPFSYLNPADIESIDILKDADATAIYGTRGANGVVLITTKKGKSGQTRTDFNVQNGWGKVAHKMKLLNLRQYLDMRYEAFKNDGAVPNPNADYDLTLWDTTRVTDWQRELIGGTAKYIDIQGAISGGNANTQFFIGTGYHKETTVFPGNFNDQKGSVNFNINNVSSNQKFKVQLTGLYLIDNNHLSGYDLTQQALQLAPDAPAMYNSDGSINWATNSSGVSTWNNYNPAAMLLLKYKNRTDNLVSNAVLSYNLLPGLDIKSSFGYTNTETHEIQTIPLSFQAPSVRPYVQRRASFSENNSNSWIIEPQISFNRKLAAGMISLVAGASIQQNTSNGQILDASGFNSDLLLQDIRSATVITPVSTVNAIYKYNAGFGRLNYTWQDKYIFDLTVRRDGSSRFGPAKQFHNFGAAGFAWIFSKEEFIKRSLPFLSFGKLRGSFGSTGSDQVGDYTFMDLYAPVSVGVPYQGAIGSTPNKIFTPDLSWEETKKIEVGLEVGFLQDRILLSTSFYHHRSTNQLAGYLLPSIAGFTTVQKNLPALVQNKGWEFDLRTTNIKYKNFQWTSSINLTMNRNALISGANGLSAYYQAKIGYPLTSRFVYRFLGVDPLTGQYQVADSHGNPTLSPNPSTDATVLVDINPKFYGGFQNSISYKGFQLDFLFQFKNQPKALNYFYGSHIPGSFTGSFGGNQSVNVLNHWQQPGDVKPIQRYSQNLSTYPSYSNAQQSDQVYSDASFFRLKNLSLSWQLPMTWKKKLHLQNMRLYAQGQNLWTVTSFYGLDPASPGSTLLPPLRVITGGIQVTF